METPRLAGRRRRSHDAPLSGGTGYLRYLAPMVAVLVLLAALLAAPPFIVAQPVVVGNRLVQADAIAQASGVAGKSVFLVLVDSAATERAVLDLRPIASAHVAVSWPNGVTITVAERQPAAVWRAGGGAWLVSADGIVLGEASGDSPPLAIDDLDVGRVFVGGRVDSAAIAYATALRDGLRDYLSPQAVFTHSQADGLSASLQIPGSKAKPVRVLFGQDGDVDARLETWKRLAPDLGSGKLKAEVVDLRIADRPYVR